MKILGCILFALSAVVGALAVTDAFYLTTAGQIWDILNYVIVVALAICVFLGVVHLFKDPHALLGIEVLLTVFAFLVFTETWVGFITGTDVSAMQWLWVDAFAAAVLLRTGVHLIVEKELP